MEYTQVNSTKIKEMIENKTLTKMTAVKNIPVKAIKLTQEIVDGMLAEGGYKTVVIDDEGKPFLETTNKKINVGDMFVTNQIAGYDNSYIIPAAKFEQLYTVGDKPNTFNPAGEDRTVYAIPQGLNLVFEAPWGGDMRIRAGGVIVPESEPGKFYGINPEEFKATHSVKDSQIQNNVSQVLETVRATTDTTEKTVKPK